MSQETKTITQETVGYSFYFERQVMKKIPNETKYPDETTEKASVGGHTSTKAEAEKQLDEAIANVREAVK